MYRDPLADSLRESTGLVPQPAAQPLPRRSLASRVLREPLTHFVAIGLAIFLVSHGIEAQRSRYTIALGDAELQRIATSYAQQYGAQPTPRQMRTMVDNQVREEIYLREGLALGLDRNDEIVRRRIAQKFDFLQQDQAAPREPTAAQLAAWYAAHKDRFAEPRRVSFEQRYFAPDRRGDAAAKALAQVALTANVQGDAFPGPPTAVALSHDEIERIYGGTGFGEAVLRAPVGRWAGPFRSGFGWHVVRLTEDRPAHTRSFAEARDDVRRDWIEADRNARNDAAWQALRARYTVTLPGAAQ